MKIKIVSDGTSTKVLDAHSGEELEGVQLVNFMAPADSAPEAFLHVVGVQCEILVDARAQLLQPEAVFDVEDLDVVPQDLK